MKYLFPMWSWKTESGLVTDPIAEPLLWKAVGRGPEVALAKIVYIDGCERAGRQVGEMFVGREDRREERLLNMEQNNMEWATGVTGQASLNWKPLKQAEAD